jgi:two-component system cell cycle sensor histidine kinase/response regulator CckA
MTALRLKAARRRILVVEDDAAVGTLVLEVLSAAGYQTDVTTSLAAAVAAAREHRYDLVISDLVLGQEDGQDVVEAVQKLQPQVKSLFMSGYARPRYGATSNDPVLATPFTGSELLDRVRRMLGEEPAPDE